MIKSKRLKNFCEVCRKQCKDENGYHCHLNSGHHQNRLRQLATNPQQHIQKYSNELQNKIVQILKTKYPGEPKDLQDLYQQYAEQKHHVKFNFTRWKDISQFAEHLKTVRNIKVVGKLPYCNVTYVVSKAGDFMKKRRQEQISKKKQREKQLEEKRLQQRIIRMRETEVQRYKQHQQKMRMRENQQQFVDIENGQFRIDLDQKKIQPSRLFKLQQKNQREETKNQSKFKQSNIDKLLNQIENKQKQKVNQGSKKPIQPQQQQFEWILPGIIVKVKPHQIPEVFHGKKANIQKVPQPFIAQIKLGNATLNIDQTYLQTVIPKPGNQVRLLKGKYKNLDGLLKEADIQNGVGIIQIISQGQETNQKNKIVKAPFNQFSKVA